MIRPRNANTLRMWKFMLVFVILLSVCSFSGCDVTRMSSLEDLSKPYTGVYACDRLMFGAENRTDDFSFLRLELDYGGGFTFSYETKEGGCGEWEGTYAVDPKRGELTLTAVQSGISGSRTFRMEDGAILFEDQVLGKNVYAEFRM